MQAFLVGLQVEDAGVAGVVGAFKDGDRPCMRCRPEVFLNLRPRSGNLAWVRSL